MGSFSDLVLLYMAVFGSSLNFFFFFFNCLTFHSGILLLGLFITPLFYWFVFIVSLWMIWCTVECMWSTWRSASVGVVEKIVSLCHKFSRIHCYLNIHVIHRQILHSQVTNKFYFMGCLMEKKSYWVFSLTWNSWIF